jgi:uncharacterized integral membrane protein
MIFLFATVLFLLFVGLFGFMITNIDYTTSVTLLETNYHNVPLIRVVIISVIVGAAATGILAVIEGAKSRLENRRLKRTCRTLETELNYFRTQPGSSSRTKNADEGAPATTPAVVQPTKRPKAISPPASAPVYDSDGSDSSRDPEDGTYTGGRAV